MGAEVGDSGCVYDVGLDSAVPEQVSAATTLNCQDPSDVAYVALYFNGEQVDATTEESVVPGGPLSLQAGAWCGSGRWQAFVVISRPGMDARVYSNAERTVTTTCQGDQARS